MRKIFTLTFLLAVLALGTWRTADAQTYTFTTIDSPGAENTELHGINENGLIVGAHTLSDRTVHSLLTNDSASSFTVFDPPGSSNPPGVHGDISAASGINNSDRIVGYTYNAAADRFLGYERDAGGSFTFFDHPSVTATGPQAGTAFSGINDAGMIAGAYGNDFGAASGDNHDFIKNGATVTPFAGPPGSTFTILSGINNSGQLVGLYYTGTPFVDEQLGYFYDGTTFHTIAVPGSPRRASSA